MPGYYEPAGDLDPRTRALSHGINTLIEELEATDYYNQRVSTCSDPDLRKLMEHNRDEELEHAAMAIEWLRRQFPQFDAELRQYLFTTGDLIEIEEGEGDHGDSGPAATGLGIGKIK